MDYETRLPDRYKSWIEFYQKNQRHFDSGVKQITEVLLHNPIGSEALETKTYSIRYIKKQALQELMKERFTDEEVNIILLALDQMRQTSSAAEPVFTKLLTILDNRRKRSQ